MATKKAKKVKVETNTIDFSNSVEKIKETTKTVNKEVVDTAIEVLEDLRNNGAKFRTIATERVNEVMEKATLKNGVKFVKNTAESVNEYSVETAEEIIEEVVKGGKAWQDFVEKALKNGVKLYGEQQEVVFDALENLKSQYKSGTFKLREIFNFPYYTAEVKAEKAAKEVTKKAKAAIKTTKKTATKAAAKAKKAVANVAEKPAASKPRTKKATTTATKKAASKKAVATIKNDLKKIEGIGPKIEEHLNKGGIKTFQQLADASQETLKGILAAAGPRYKMHDPTTWSAQAALAAAGKTAELAKLQDELKGGRVK